MVLGTSLHLGLCSQLELWKNVCYHCFSWENCFEDISLILTLGRPYMILVNPFSLCFFSFFQNFTLSIHFLLETLQVLGYLENRRKVHEDAINFCQDVLRKKVVDWQAICGNNLSQDSQPIHNVDLVVTIGGDGTLLQASHFMDDSIPVLGVNSDPTQVQEVVLYMCFCGFSWLFPGTNTTLLGEVSFTLFSLLQVEEFSEEFDATRSTGHLCAATIGNFEQVRLPHWF